MQLFTKIWRTGLVTETLEAPDADAVQIGTVLEARIRRLSAYIGLRPNFRAFLEFVLALRAEIVNSRRSHLQGIRSQTEFYVHGPVVQGHTSRGQVLKVTQYDAASSGQSAKSVLSTRPGPGRM